MPEDRGEVCARVWETTREADAYWWDCANRSMDREPVPARAEVSPDSATAGQPGVWRVSIALERDKILTYAVQVRLTLLERLAC